MVDASRYSIYLTNYMLSATLYRMWAEMVKTVKERREYARWHGVISGPGGGYSCTDGTIHQGNELNVQRLLTDSC
jgi:hypothetical protein